MAFRYLIYRTDFGDTIVRESAVSGSTTGGTEQEIFTNFVIPEIQPLYLWRVTGGTDVVPNLDSNITDWLGAINPISPDDYVTYGIYTGFTAQTSGDISYISGVTDNNYSIFQSFTAQTQTDLAGKIDIVTGATGNVGIFTVDGNLEDSGFAISGLTGGSGQDVYVSGMTYVGSTLTLQRTEGFPDLQVSIVTSGASDGVVSGGTLSGTILSLQRTEGLPDVTVELSGLTSGIEADILYLSGVTSGNTVAITNIENDITYISGITSGNTVNITNNANDIIYISGITDTKLDTAIFNTYTGDTQPIIDAALTGATNGLTASGRDVELGGTLTKNTTIDGTGSFDLDILNLDRFSLTFSGISTILDNGGNGGIRYAADYSADYVDRSLVDKAYVDMLVAGLDWKNAALVATASGDTDLDLTGGTFTGTIDGITLSDGDRVLIKNQDANPEQNGIYDYSASTSGFTRSDDFDGAPSGEVTQGATLMIITGDTNQNTAWTLVTPDPITVGTTPLDWVLFSSGNVTYVAGVGIDISGNIISFDGASVAGDFLQWTGTQLNVTGLTSQSDFNSYTAQTTADLSYISGVTDGIISDITYISGITDQNTADIVYISGITSGLSASISGITDDITYISGITSGNTIDIANNTADIAYISGITSGNSQLIADNAADIVYISGETAANDADIAYLSGQTDNKIDKVTGATGNLGQFTVDGNLEDTGVQLSGITASTANEIQLVSTGVTDVNTIVATAIDWHVADFSGASYNWSGGSGIYILETGDYEVSYHFTVAQVGGGQPRSVGAYLILNNTETLDRTSSATHIAAADHKGSLICPPTVFSFTAGDRLDLAAFRIGGAGTVNTTAFETVILIKKKGTLV